MRAIAAAAVALVSGCASLDHAGSASYSVRPVQIGERIVCCEVAIVNGKEYATLDAMLEKRGDDYTVLLSERGVGAFAGQRIAAGGLKSAATAAAGAAAAAALAPVAGAALASGAAGAAAAVAGAAVLADEGGR
jgi:hypothetical protein